MKMKYYGHPKFYKIVEELKDLHSRKNFDYAGTGDPLGNFDRCGQMMKAVLSEGGFEELKVLLVYMSKQFDGVIDMIGKNRTAQVEGIKDKLTDIAIYAIIGRIIYEEKINKKK